MLVLKLYTNTAAVHTSDTAKTKSQTTISFHGLQNSQIVNSIPRSAARISDQPHGR